MRTPNWIVYSPMMNFYWQKKIKKSKGYLWVQVIERTHAPMNLCAAPYFHSGCQLRSSPDRQLKRGQTQPSGTYVTLSCLRDSPWTDYITHGGLYLVKAKISLLKLCFQAANSILFCLNLWWVGAEKPRGCFVSHHVNICCGSVTNENTVG